MLQQYKTLLKEFLSTKSISTDTQFIPEINKTADWLKKIFEQNQFDVQVIKGYDNPIVIATYNVDSELDTCLIYGHYDVQPADITEGWKSDPFTVSERDSKLFGRGVVDNKGQVLIHITTAFELIKQKKLGYNLIFMIEGNEETGSPLLEKFILDNKDTLKANFTLISDGEMDIENPSLEAGFRGGFNSTLTIKTSTTELHSGLYGGVVPNAAQEMNTILGKLIDSSNNKVLIPHFYDDVDPITPELLKNNSNIQFSEDHFKKLAGTKAIIKQPEYDVYTLIGLMPTIQVTGIQSGYVGEGYRNSIPAKAVAKINIRLVESQNPEKIIEIIKKYLKEIIPSYIDFSFEITEAYEGIKIDFNNQYSQRAIQTVLNVYKKKPVLKFCGGSIPIVIYFKQILNLHNVLVPLGNEDCAMHAVDENFRIEYVEKGLEFSYEFLQKIKS